MAWRVAESLQTLLNQFNSRYPTRSKASDGSIGDAAHASRSSDHNPWFVKNGQGIVTARDFTHDPAKGMDIDRLTDELAASRDPRIKYIIANGYILDSRPGNNPWRWMKYSGSNPHNKHFHLSVNTHNCDDTRPWNLPSFGGGAPAPAPAPIYTPGGIESMGFNDKYRDWAGNEQSVLAWMDRLDKRTNVEIPAMIADLKAGVDKAVFELTYKHPTRVEGADPKSYTDTMLGYSVNADKYGFENAKRLDELEAKMDRILKALEAKK